MLLQSLWFTSTHNSVEHGGVLLYLNLTMQSTNEYLNITLTIHKLPADLHTVKVKRQMNHPVIQAMIYCQPPLPSAVVKDWGRMYKEPPCIHRMCTYCDLLYFLRVHKCSKGFLKCTYAGEPTAVWMHAIHILLWLVATDVDFLHCGTR